MTSPRHLLTVTDSIWSARRARLRALEAEDWPRFRDFDVHTADQRSSDRVHPPRSPADYERWVAEHKPAASDDEFWLVVADIDDGRAVGAINTFQTDRTAGTFWYGISIFREEQRRGYAGEAVRIVQRYMFGERRYQKCQAGVFSDNPASLGLHQSLGFTQEGRLRRAVFHDGSHHDLVIFGMTVDEFRNLH